MSLLPNAIARSIGSSRGKPTMAAAMLEAILSGLSAATVEDPRRDDRRTLTLLTLFPALDPGNKISNPRIRSKAAGRVRR